MKRIGLLLCFCLVAFFTYAQTPIKLGDKYNIASQVFSEEREVWVGLPNAFDARKTYPTIYVLDAESQFDIVLSVVKELAANDKIPAHLVVGVPHINEKHRFKDLTFTTNNVGSGGLTDASMASSFNTQNTSGGKAFYTHLKKEIIPFIEGKYKTNGFDVFIGHSLSGYFGAYIMTMESPFEAYQLYDPSIWYNKADVITAFEKSNSKPVQSNVFIATALGGIQKPTYNTKTHRQFLDLLQANKITTKQRIYPTEYHGSVRLPALIDGLSHLYQGYAFGYISPTRQITVNDAKQHYKTFSDKVNYTFNCPLDVYRWIGYTNHAQKKWTEAIKAYTLSLEIYINNVNVCTELAECYYNTKNYKLSLVYYKKALALNPSDKALQAKVKDLARY